MSLTTNKPLKIRTKEMIESDKDVTRWINNLNSESTKRIYSEGLLKFSEHSNQTPQEIVTSFKTNKKTAEDILTDFIYETRKTQTPKSVHNNLVSVKSWLKHNDIIINRKINCGNTKSTPTTEDETVPSQDELNRILNYANPRGKTFIALIAFAGLRPNTAVNIKLKDLPDLTITPKSVQINKKPAQIKIKAQFSKNGRSYFTFLSSEGCNYTTEYLQSRIDEGETLTPESTLISFSQKSTQHSITRKGYSKKIKRTFEKAHYNGRPYVLRSYFDTAILNSGIPFIIQQFIMGHAGTIEATYTVNKNLPQSQIDEIRQQFKDKIEPKLETITIKARNEIDLLKTENKELREQINKIEEKLTNTPKYPEPTIEEQKQINLEIKERDNEYQTYLKNNPKKLITAQKEQEEHKKYLKQHPELNQEIEKLDMNSRIEQLEKQIEELKTLAKTNTTIKSSY